MPLRRKEQHQQMLLPVKCSLDGNPQGLGWLRKSRYLSAVSLQTLKGLDQTVLFCYLVSSTSCCPLHCALQTRCLNMCAAPVFIVQTAPQFCFFSLLCSFGFGFSLLLFANL
jgi:hypothetical protein